MVLVDVAAQDVEMDVEREINEARAARAVLRALDAQLPPEQFTQSSNLWQLERVLRARPANDPASDAALLGLAEKMLARELHHLNRLYEMHVKDCVATAACPLACDRGWEHDADGSEVWPSDDDVIRVLTTPMAPAIYMAHVLAYLGVKSPKILRRALHQLYPYDLPAVEPASD